MREGTRANKTAFIYNYALTYNESQRSIVYRNISMISKILATKVHGPSDK